MNLNGRNMANRSVEAEPFCVLIGDFCQTIIPKKRTTGTFGMAHPLFFRFMRHQTFKLKSPAGSWVYKSWIFVLSSTNPFKTGLCIYSLIGVSILYCPAMAVSPSSSSNRSLGGSLTTPKRSRSMVIRSYLSLFFLLFVYSVGRIEAYSKKQTPLLPAPKQKRKSNDERPSTLHVKSCLPF